MYQISLRSAFAVFQFLGNTWSSLQEQPLGKVTIVTNLVNVWVNVCEKLVAKKESEKS